MRFLIILFAVLLFVTLGFILIFDLRIRNNVANLFEEYKSENLDNFIEFRDHRIFCIVLTTQAKLLTKAHTVVDAWASKCDNYKLVTLLRDKNSIVLVPTEILDHVLEPPGLVNDTYEQLTDKVMLAFKHIYLNYPDYDWYLKADDDTFIFTENLRFFLSLKNPKKPISFGYDIYLDSQTRYHSGGAGYVMSSEAFRRLGSALNSNISQFKNNGIEDQDISRCLQQLNVSPENSLDEFERDRFHPYTIEEHFKGTAPGWIFYNFKHNSKIGFECCSETSISFHYMSPNGIRNLSQVIVDLQMRALPYGFRDILKALKLI